MIIPSPADIRVEIADLRVVVEATIVHARVPTRKILRLFDEGELEPSSN